VAAFENEPIQSRLCFKYRGQGTQADFARKAFQIKKKSVGSRLRNVLVGVQGAGA